MENRFAGEQIIGVLKEAETCMKVAELFRNHGISNVTYYNWKVGIGGMAVSEAQRLKALKNENSWFTRLPAESSLYNAALKDVVGRAW
jgi:putative transposase